MSNNVFSVKKHHKNSILESTLLLFSSFIVCHCSFLLFP
ncbi:hypothetical protein NTHI1209_00418 [Haemophilus influenzae]|uniref:Uncharacterized protein n=1 Tax=Haemophilus influenzae TaxID=727 RepID=A0A158SVC2_HAEIF|nr:hypothetical protein NTHI1209_00418 [Haemophilus influenzae]